MFQILSKYKIWSRPLQVGLTRSDPTLLYGIFSCPRHTLRFIIAFGGSIFHQIFIYSGLKVFF